MNIDTKVYRKHESPTFGNTLLGAVPLVSEVYLMDCIELMKHYPDKYFDLAVCDPPYGMLGNTFRVKSKQFTNGFASSALDKSELSEAKISLGDRPTIEFFSELYRVSKNQIVFGMQYFVEYLIPHQAVIIWDKGNGTNRFSDAEIAWTSFDTAVRIVNKWMQPCGRIHPTQKPIELYDWIFKEYAENGMRILDTHLGSGSSRISANRANLNFVGCDINEEYFNEQNKRYENFVSQLRMF
jgi:site-specific DNA-methyltransferase (adenine-specific)